MRTSMLTIVSIAALAAAACNRSGTTASDATAASDSPASGDMATAARGTALPRTQVYQCGDLPVTAQFAGDTVALSLDRRNLTLTLTPAASGAKYIDDEGNEFFTKGLDAAILTLVDEADRPCAAFGAALAQDTN